MSLITFFQTQRQNWEQQPSWQSADFLSGVLTALELAETEFKTIPFFNASLEAHRLRLELDEADYQLKQTRLQLAQVQQNLTAARRELHNIPHWGPKPQKALFALGTIIEDPTTKPKKKISKLRAMVATYIGKVMKENRAQSSPESLPQPVPLPE